jgi:hypothetical protein
MMLKCKVELLPLWRHSTSILAILLLGGYARPYNYGTIAPEVSADLYMVAVIESGRTELDHICRHRAVRRPELFGSAAREDFTPAIDLDFLVE